MKKLGGELQRKEEAKPALRTCAPLLKRRRRIPANGKLRVTLNGGRCDDGSWKKEGFHRPAFRRGTAELEQLACFLEEKAADSLG